MCSPSGEHITKDECEKSMYTSGHRNITPNISMFQSHGISPPLISFALVCVCVCVYLYQLDNLSNLQNIIRINTKIGGAKGYIAQGQID